MRPCEDCSENNWRFHKDGEATVATCRNCQKEIRFTKKKSSGIKITCPHCGKTMDHVKDPFSISKMAAHYYYDYIYKCPSCEYSFPDEKTKRINLV